MKTIHIKSFVPSKSYATPMQAHFGADQEHKAVLSKLPFDIKKFYGQTVTNFVFGDTFLSMCFHENQYLNVTLGEGDCLTITNTDKVIGEQKDYSAVQLIYPSGRQSIWNPSELLAKCSNKIFKGVHCCENWFFLYYSDSEYVISVSILNIDEPPKRILHWSEST